MNAIDLHKNLEGVPTNMRRMIGISAINILNAGIFANSTQECAAEARRIYRTSDLTGLWRRVQREARDILRVADKNGLTFEKPYKLIRCGRTGSAMLWGMSSTGEFRPMINVGAKRA